MKLVAVAVGVAFLGFFATSPAQRPGHGKTGSASRVVHLGSANGGRLARKALADLPPILKLVIRASQTLKFSGHRIVEQLARGELIRHQEIVTRDGPRTRIDFPADSAFAGHIIIEDSNQRSQYFPRLNEVQISPARGDESLDHLLRGRQMLRNPNVSFGDGGLVAGIPTTLATFRNGQQSVIQQLWIDPQTGAVLRRIGYRPNGAVIAQVEFTSISYGAPISEATFRMPSGAKTKTVFDILKRISRKNGFPPLMLPNRTGFKLAGASVSRKMRALVLSQSYQGPKGRLSVFEVQAQIDPQLLEKKAGNRTKVYTSSIDGFSIVLIGPYPVEQLRTLAGQMVRF